MSTVNIITAMRSSILATAGKSAASQTVAAQPEPAANDSSATISQAAKDLVAKENKIVPYSDDPRAAARFMQHMAEGFAGKNQARAQYASDPNNSLYAKFLDEAASKNFSPGTGNGAGIDLSWGKTSANLSKMEDVIHYTGGEPVTAESQAYQQKQVHSYMNAATQLYTSEKAKGTPAGEIWIKIMDIQEQQPARFRAMMGWPTAADFASSQPDAASGSVKS
ncbi:hypothetical protein [Devosia sp.]|uniref:hypothetical protein n=1 Tax=Devosia sp. TaxID=1871048 RepID=UPI0027368EE4|nr:hypothetical protein [Devosia sp.]MDP2779961.1 hypothetical protein [Devosia sp.]